MRRPSKRVTWTLTTFCLTMFICWMGGIDIFTREMATGMAWFAACCAALVCWTWVGFWK